MLELLAKGKTNPEIAAALGVSLDGAKYHVREILGKLGAENREQAVEVWTRERRPLARFVRWSRGLFAVSTARTVTLAGLGIAAAGVTAVAVVVALGGDETSPADDPPSASPSIATVTANAAATSEEMRDCDVPTTDFKLEVRPAGASREIHLFAENKAGPCTLTTTAQVTILLPSGEPADVVVNGTTLAVAGELPSDELVAGLLWSNWCQGPAPSLELRAGGRELEFGAPDPPDCTATDFASNLGPLALLNAPPAATPTPLLTGLTQVVSPPERVTVAVYSDAQPQSTNCIEVVQHIVPVAAAGDVAARPFECGGDFSRIRFAVDGSGLHYVLGVELLLIGKSTLPQPRFGDGTCNSIREHLLNGSEEPESAAYILVCSVQPLPRGAPTTTNAGVIWARIPDGAGPDVLPPPETPCWELSRFLGSPRERTSHPVQCSLD